MMIKKSLDKYLIPPFKNGHLTHVNPKLYIKYRPWGNSNEEGLKWAMLQCDEVLEQLKVMNEHVG
jgi:hypothetical protein